MVSPADKNTPDFGTIRGVGKTMSDLKAALKEVKEEKIKDPGKLKTDLEVKLKGLSQKSRITAQPEKKEKLAKLNQQIRMVKVQLLANAGVSGIEKIKNVVKAIGILIGREDLPKVDVKSAANALISSSMGDTKALDSLLNAKGMVDAKNTPTVLGREMISELRSSLVHTVDSNSFEKPVVMQSVRELANKEENPARKALLNELLSGLPETWKPKK